MENKSKRKTVNGYIAIDGNGNYAQFDKNKLKKFRTEDEYQYETNAISTGASDTPKLMGIFNLKAGKQVKVKITLTIIEDVD